LSAASTQHVAAARICIRDSVTNGRQDGEYHGKACKGGTGCTLVYRCVARGHAEQPGEHGGGDGRGVRLCKAPQALHGCVPVDKECAWREPVCKPGDCLVCCLWLAGQNVDNGKQAKHHQSDGAEREHCK
jgi:hypothetical protein